MKKDLMSKYLIARSEKQAWVISAAVVVFAMIASNVMMFLLNPIDVAYSLVIKTPFIAFVIAAPLATFFSKIMLKNYELTKSLRRMVERDRLTDVATRDYFFSRMEAEPDGIGVSLMIDIDHFKSVNDTHGHIAGDSVIKMVAGILKSECRESDIVCRFGGEEFVIFLRGADAERGWTVAERMRQRVEQAMLEVGTEHLRVTISVGGSLKSSAEDINRAINSADAALYRAKALGRNRTETTWAEVPERPGLRLSVANGMPR